MIRAGDEDTDVAGKEGVEGPIHLEYKENTLEFVNLHSSNTSFFLASFALGRSLAVSGEIPVSPLVSFVLFFDCC